MSRSRKLLSTFFLFTGLAHLTFARRFFEAIVPGWVPGSPEAVNVAAGIAEATGGALVLVPRLERVTRLYLVGLLLAVYPANVQMAVAPQTLRGAKGVPRWLLWARLPLQALPIIWVRRTLADRED